MPSSMSRRPTARASCTLAAPRKRPTMAWPAMAERVERECEEQEHLHADLVRGDRVVADPRGDGGGGEQRDDQRGGADHQTAADASRWRGCPAGRGRTDAPSRRTARATITTYASRGAVLRDHGAPRRARDPVVEAVHEQQLEHEVQPVGRHRDHEGRARVLHAAQVAGARQREQERGRPEDADAEVGDRVRGDVRGGAHDVGDLRCQGQADDGEDHDPARSPANSRRPRSRRPRAGARRRAGGRPPRSWSRRGS